MMICVGLTCRDVRGGEFSLNSCFKIHSINLHQSSPAVFGSSAADRGLLCTGLLSVMSPKYSPADVGNVITLPLNQSLEVVSTKYNSFSTVGQILI